jgi:hypothetical protein
MAEFSFQYISIIYNISVNLRDKYSTDDKECMASSIETDKPSLWVREHSCPTRARNTEGDLNAAWNVLSRQLYNPTALGVCRLARLLRVGAVGGHPVSPGKHSGW